MKKTSAQSHKQIHFQTKLLRWITAANIQTK